MQAEKMDHMKEALSKRRGKGLEVIIGLGNPHEDGESNPAGPHEGYEDKREHMMDVEAAHDHSTDYKRSDLAPPPRAEADREAPIEGAEDLHGPHTEGVVAGQHAMNPGDVPTNDDAKAHFSQNMTEADIRDMANRKPRSLAERARQYAFGKGKTGSENTRDNPAKKKVYDGFSKNTEDLSP